MSINESRHPKRISVARYHAMIKAGILTEVDRIELLEGWLVALKVRNERHYSAQTRIDYSLRPLLPTDWRLRLRPAVTTKDSEPEPDFVVIVGPHVRYQKRHPMAGDIAILGEIAEQTLAQARTTLARIYARACIREYWIINLVDRQVEVATKPSGPQKQPKYRRWQVYPAGSKVPVVIDGEEVGRIPVTAMLPG